MTRIDELQKKYPTIPKEIIVKWEILGRGIRDGGDLDKICHWQKAGAHYSYQSYDHDVTLKEWVDKKPSRLQGDRILRPDTLLMENGIGAAIRLDTRSPYEIRELANGQFRLFEGEEQVDMAIYFPPPRPRPTDGPITSKGTPIATLMSCPRRCAFVMPVRYCEYFATRDQCKFCNFNNTQEDSRSIGLDRPTTINLDDVVEGYQILSSQVKLLEVKFEMGGFMNSENEGRIYFDFVGSIARAVKKKPNMTIRTQAMDRKDMQRLKDAGLDCMSLQMEVWDSKLFPEILPGKAKHAPQERWLESFSDAVDIFGVGNVGGKIIAGLTLIPANGHQTWQEARDSQIEGNRWLIKNGVFPIFTNLRLPPGSVYAEDKSNREKLPPTEYFLDVAKAHHESMQEFGLYEKLNRLLYCGLCCVTGPYVGELGMLALAGDVGSWMAPAVPAEENWIAKFLASVKEPTSTR